MFLSKVKMAESSANDVKNGCLILDGVFMYFCRSFYVPGNYMALFPFKFVLILLQETISRDNCRRDRACFSTPPTCNPAAQGSCFFVSTRAVYGNADNLTFELSGESSGYIAVGLSRDNREV